MSCANWEERVAEFCTGMEDPAVAAHLEGCASCRRVAEETRACLTVLRDSDYAAVRARVLSTVAPAPSRRAFWKWASATALATAAAVVVAVFAMPSRPVEELPVRALAVPSAPPIVAPVAMVRHAPVRHRAASHKPLRAASAEPDTKPLVVKLMTDDPNIVIYWIATKSGE